jgi:hypothetical protein
MRLYARAFVGLHTHTHTHNIYKRTLLTRPRLCLCASRRLFYLFGKHKTQTNTHAHKRIAKSAFWLFCWWRILRDFWEIYWMCLPDVPPFNFLLAYTKQIASLIGVCCAPTRARSQHQLLRAAQRSSAAVEQFDWKSWPCLFDIACSI